MKINANKKMPHQNFMSDLVFEDSEYERLEVIGRGRYGTVYKMRNTRTGEEIAAKMFNEEQYSEEASRLFLREIETLKELDHPNIIKILGFWLQSPGHPATIYTPYYRNGSLAKYIYGNEFNFYQKLEIIRKLADAMDYLHHNKIMHRDLKPENILIDDNFEPILCDFGLSKYDDPDLSQTNGVGTPIWMAPELYEEAPYTKKVDVFSFGLICYCILSGQPPLNLRYQLSIQDKILNHEISELSKICKSFHVLIANCLNIYPERRIDFDQISKFLKDDYFFEVYAKSNNTIPILVRPEETIWSLKNKILQFFNCTHLLQLMIDGKVIDNDMKTIKSYGITPNCIIHFVFCLLG